MGSASLEGVLGYVLYDGTFPLMWIEAYEGEPASPEQTVDHLLRPYADKRVRITVEEIE